MKLDRVYIGYTFDYKEHLLEDRGTYFIDLLTNDKILKEDVFTNLLQPISILDSEHKWRLVRSLKKLYQKDREKKLDMEKVFIGDVYQVTEITGREYSGNNLWNLGVKTEFNAIKLKEEVLLYQVEVNDYINLLSGEEYNINPFIEKGNLYINDFLYHFNYHLFQSNRYSIDRPYFEIEMSQPKKKVLENYYQLYQKGVK